MPAAKHTAPSSRPSRDPASAELEALSLSDLKATPPLSSIDLTQSGSRARIGADSRLFAGDHLRRLREFARRCFPKLTLSP